MKQSQVYIQYNQVEPGEHSPNLLKNMVQNYLPVLKQAIPNLVEYNQSSFFHLFISLPR